MKITYHEIGGVDMNKYGLKAQEKVKKAMHELKHGTLKSGTGKKVTDKKQAVAIGLSEAKKAGGKYQRSVHSSFHKLN